MQANWWLMDFIRSLLFSLDQMVYSLIETFYNLFAYISNLTIFDNATFQDFTGRVYLILGIVMLFKIAFSLISLFANPDNLMDGNKGVTGIVKRLILSLVLITFIPTIFSIAFQFQTIVIHDNVIGNFFLGNLIGTDEGSATAEELNKIQRNAGKMVAFNVFGAFYYPEDFVIEKDENGNIKQDKNGNIQYVNDGKWSDTVKGHPYNDDGTLNFSEYLKNEEFLNYTRNESYSISDYGKFVNVNHRSEDDTYYVMHYMYVISTVAGVVVAWIFLGFCFDTAIRAVKLSALQLLAPIPIFSYIDPSKGEKIFKNWISTTLSTYLSLFMRLILIYFVLYICYLLQRNGVQEYSLAADGTVTIGKIQNSNTLSNFAIMMVYIGLLLFAKDAPKLFGDMFGIKMEGTFGSKLAKMGIIGTGLAATLGVTKLLGEGYKTINRTAAKGKLEHQSQKIIDKYKDDPSAMTDEDAAILRANAAQYSKLSEQKSHFGKALTSGVTAGIIGGAAGAKFGAGFKNGMKRANTTQKNREQGITLGNEIQEKVGRFFGSSNEYGDFGHWSEELKTAKNEEQKLSVQESRLREHYSDMVTGLTKKYRISPDEAVNLATGDVSGIASLIEKHTEELRTKRTSLEQLYNTDKNLTDERKKSLESQLELVNSQISSIESDFNGLSDSAVMVEKIDAKHQAAVKKVSKLQKNLDSLKNKN